MTLLLDYFSSPSQVVPTVLLAAVSAPVFYIWHCIVKLTELKKIASLRHSEYRRLLPKISSSKAFYFIKICLIVLTNILIGLMFYLAATGFEIYSIPIVKIAVALLGFMIVFSTATLFECYIDANTILEFEVKLSKREQDKKRVEAVISKLHPNQNKA